MVTILSRSVRGKELRGFRTFQWNSSNNLPETATKTFWQVRSNIHKFNFIEVMKMDFFFRGMSLEETRCLFDAPGVLSDDLFVELLIAKQSEIPMEILVQRLTILQSLQNTTPWSKNLLFTLLGNLRCEIEERRQAIRPATKFSGYVRNSSSVGTKNSKSPNIVPEIVEWTKPVKIDYLRFLTVGEFTSGSPGDNFFILTRTKSPKRSSKNPIIR